MAKELGAGCGEHARRAVQLRCYCRADYVQMAELLCWVGLFVSHLREKIADRIKLAAGAF